MLLRFFLHLFLVNQDSNLSEVWLLVWLIFTLLKLIYFWLSKARSSFGLDRSAFYTSRLNPLPIVLMELESMYCTLYKGRVSIFLFPSCFKTTAVLWIILAVTVKRLYQLSWGLDSLHIFIDQAKKDLRFDLNVRHFVCVWVSDCLTITTTRLLILITMKFEINIFSTKDFLISLLLQNGGCYVGLFHSYERRERPTAQFGATSEAYCAQNY